MSSVIFSQYEDTIANEVSTARAKRLSFINSSYSAAYRWADSHVSEPVLINQATKAVENPVGSIFLIDGSVIGGGSSITFGASTMTVSATLLDVPTITATSYYIGTTRRDDRWDAAFAASHSAAGVSSSASVALTISAQTISATVLPAGVDHNSLNNLTVGNPHTQYIVNDPTSTGSMYSISLTDAMLATTSMIYFGSPAASGTWALTTVGDNFVVQVNTAPGSNYVTKLTVLP